MTPEFSRPYDVRHLPDRVLTIAANPTERAALAERFGVIALDKLAAEARLTRDGEVVRAEGRFEAELVQACAVSGEPLKTRLAEPFALSFVRSEPAHGADEEIELAADDLDEVIYEGNQVDLGEAIAQSLSLAIDPYATGPEADAVRREAGLSDAAANGAFAALAALKK